MRGGFERFIGVDWSGAARPSGQHVYVAEAHRQDARITIQSVVRARDRSAVEGYLHAWYQSYGMVTTALRFANAYGPYSLHKTSVVAAPMIEITSSRETRRATCTVLLP